MKYTHVNNCMSVCVGARACVFACMCVCFPIFSVLQVLIYGFPSVFFFVVFFNLLHFKAPHEELGASSIWALIERETEGERGREIWG